MRGRVLVVAFVGLMLVVGTGFVLGVATTGAPSHPAPVADLDELRAEKVMFFEDHHVFLVYNHGDPLALSDDAQHLGDRVIFCESSQLFESPFHAEKFDLRGYFFSGPGRRGLARYGVRIEDDRVHVDLSQYFQGSERGEGPPLKPKGQPCVP